MFRQKNPKPFLPVRGLSDPAQKQGLRGASASTPNKMAQKLAEFILSLVEGLKQSLPRCRFGAAAPPRTTQGLKLEPLGLCGTY